MISQLVTAFNSSGSSHANVTYLEKLERDIEHRLSQPEGNKTAPLDSAHGKESKSATPTSDEPTQANEKSPTKPIRIHTDSDVLGSEPGASLEEHTVPNPTPDKTRFGQSQGSRHREERVEIVLGPAKDIQPPYLPSEKTEINKEIFVKGHPKMNGHVTIEESVNPKSPGEPTDQQLKNAAKIVNGKQETAGGFRKQQLQRHQQQQNVVSSNASRQGKVGIYEWMNEWIYFT